jgi:acyl carrier protein
VPTRPESVADPGSSGSAEEQTIEEVVRQIVRALAPEPIDDIERTTDLRDDLGYHSLALVELGFLVEDAFLLDPIPRELAELVRNPGHIIDYVVEKAAERGFVFEDDGHHVRALLEDLEEWTAD